MKNSLCISLAFLFFGSMTASFASASSVTVVPFPAAGDSFYSAAYGSGRIPSGWETDSLSTAGDYVTTAVLALPTNSVTGMTFDWTYQNWLGGGNTENWYLFINGKPEAYFILPDDNHEGQIQTLTGTDYFTGIAPVNGGYQIELVLQNTVPPEEGSVQWADGGTT